MKRKRTTNKIIVIHHQATLPLFFQRQQHQQQQQQAQQEQEQEQKQETKQQQNKKKKLKCERKSFTPAIRNKVAAQQKWCCKYCSQILTDVFEIDHIIPLHLNGENNIENLQALCRNCHGRKTIDETIVRSQQNKQKKIKHKDVNINIDIENEKTNTTEKIKKKPKIVVSKYFKKIKTKK